ncbi:MAG: formyltransferase family protein [Candidatus Tantalella remota]|nr:formyltransferase family protein [Candidatus Tantalella remota]
MTGRIGLLAAMSEGANIVTSVAYSEDVKSLLKSKDIPVYKSVKDEEFLCSFNNIDLVLSVHCREIVGGDILGRAKNGGINVHPYLYKYKGADPVVRALKDGEYKASVGVHRMTDIVDEGEVLFEEYLDVTGAETPQEVYVMLYPLYAKSVSKAIRMVR